MATKHYCDRCDEVIYSYSTIGSEVKIPYPDGPFDHQHTRIGQALSTVDLCNDCIKALRTWAGLEVMERIKE